MVAKTQKFVNKIQKFAEVRFAGTVFVGTILVVSTISSHVIIESSVTLSIYLTFSQLHIAGFEI